MNFFVVSKGYVQVFPNRLRLQVAADAIVIEKTGLFSTPDRLLADFATAETLLREAISEAYASWSDPRPLLIMHPKDIPEASLSEMDKRLLLALGRGAGARHCSLWQGADLSTDELTGIAPPKSG
jgi:hypothetical protein